jgi:iron-sulfur cluster repair protein YtfE (RIC family)
VTLCPQLRRLAAEHARWLEEIGRGSRRDGAERAAWLLALWDAEILPHCRSEEEVLLPELARRLSEADATVVFTLGDHVALRRLARELRAAGAADRDAACALLERRLAEHTAFEERTLFPALQETLGCDHVAALATELTASRNERKPRPAEGPPDEHEAPNTTKGRKP